MLLSLRSAVLALGCVFLVIGLMNFTEDNGVVFIRRKLQAQNGWEQQQQQQGGPLDNQQGDGNWGQQQGGGGWQQPPQQQGGGGGWGQSSQQQPPPQQQINVARGFPVQQQNIGNRNDGRDSQSQEINQQQMEGGFPQQKQVQTGFQQNGGKNTQTNGNGRQQQGPPDGQPKQMQLGGKQIVVKNTQSNGKTQQNQGPPGDQPIVVQGSGQQNGAKNVQSKENNQQQQGPSGDQQSGGEKSGQCEVRNPKEAKVIPSWAASFPGSGIKLFWQVVQGTTGLFTGDDNDSTGQMRKGVVVTVKTHFPSPHVSPKFYLMDTMALKTAFLLTRNPVSALPSYYKFLYRFELGNGPDAEIPIGDWVAWRNENLELQMTKWVEHTKWWLDHYATPGSLMVVEFEKLTSKTEGPKTLSEMGKFLSATNPTIENIMAPDSDLPCLWNLLIGDTVQRKVPSKAAAKIPEGPKYPYTLENLDMLISHLKTLKRELGTNPNAEFVTDYIKGVTVAKRQVEKLLAS